MTAKEKAEELINKFTFEIGKFNTKQSAIICVDEIIKALEEYDERTEEYLKKEFNLDYQSVEKQNMDSTFRYWEKVKQEIELL